MSLAQELVNYEYLTTSSINGALRSHNVEEITQYIRSSEDSDVFYLNCPPVNEEFGRHVSDAIIQNSHIRELLLRGFGYIRDLVPWIGSRNTLVNMMSLESVVVYVRDDLAVLDCPALFPLLLTSTSLRKLEIRIVDGRRHSDDVMSALLTYLSAASLREFELHTRGLSEAAFAALCNGVALSTVRQISLFDRTLHNFDPETAAESLARMIVESSLEDVTIWTWNENLISALKLTTPVRNMDFAFTSVVHVMHGNLAIRFMINRKWKPLIFGANTPLALWPHILEKSHVFPETSHGSADIVFYVLRQKPDLVPAP